MTIPEKDAVGDPYTVFQSHAHGVADDTNVVIQAALRNAHPNEVLTTFDTAKCDLEKWAEAGHATFSSLEVGNQYPTVCEYVAPSSRLVDELGSIKNQSIFGHFALEYHGIKHHFYVAQWPGQWGDPKRYNFLLSPPATTCNSEQVDVHDLVSAASRWTAELHNEIYVFDDGHWSKSAKLWTSVQSASWDEIVLDPVLKQTVPEDVRSFFDQRELYRAYGIPWKRGIILHGTPGCGKTASIRALMRELGQRNPTAVESLYVKSLDTCGRKPSWCVGQIFEKARKRAPCLLIFEDLDSLVTDEVRSFFLNEVDGVEANDGIFMIGSTNHLERLDPGISKRPSRFDRKYHYALPNERDRTAYCEFWRNKLDTVGQVQFDQRISGLVASLTEGFSYAYMKELFVQSLFSMAVGTTEGDADSSKDSVPTALDETNGADSDTQPETKDKVNIPEDLQDDALLQTLTRQCAVLRKNMGSGTDASEGQQADAADANGVDEVDGMEESKSKSCSSC